MSCSNFSQTFTKLRIFREIYIAKYSTKSSHVSNQLKKSIEQNSLNFFKSWLFNVICLCLVSHRYAALLASVKSAHLASITDQFVLQLAIGATIENSFEKGGNWTTRAAYYYSTLHLYLLRRCSFRSVHATRFTLYVSRFPLVKQS